MLEQEIMRMFHQEQQTIGYNNVNSTTRIEESQKKTQTWTKVIVAVMGLIVLTIMLSAASTANSSFEELSNHFHEDCQSKSHMLAHVFDNTRKCCGDASMAPKDPDSPPVPLPLPIPVP